MDMQDEMLGVLTLYHGENDFDVNPYIPSKIEHYARASLDIADDEYIMATMRTSFGKFHRGLVIGNKGIYWLNSPLVETNVNHLTWRELSERKSQFRSHPRSVSFGDGAVFDNKGSLNKSSFVLNILDLLIIRYEKQEVESDGFVFDPTKVHTLGRSIPNNKAELKADNVDHTAEMQSASYFFKSMFNKLFGRKAS